MTEESKLASTVESWAKRPEISARSTLVTIIGDTLIPVGSSLWMSQMLSLSEVFGFSDRLVRTSMNRLVAESWLTTERVGRQSKYHLTEIALTESARASERIYRTDDADWLGEWVLVFLPRSLSAADSSRISEHLRWNGFVRVSSEVLASPGAKPESARELINLVAPDVRPAIATATFTELAGLVEDGFFLAESDATDMAAAYTEFVSRFEPLARLVKLANPVHAFGLRTMLVHDLRRIRLRWPELPVQARSPDWPGGKAALVAAEIYANVASQSATWLSEVFEMNYPPSFPDRLLTPNESQPERVEGTK